MSCMYVNVYLSYVNVCSCVSSSVCTCLSVRHCHNAMQHFELNSSRPAALGFLQNIHNLVSMKLENFEVVKWIIDFK